MFKFMIFFIKHKNMEYNAYIYDMYIFYKTQTHGI